MAIASLPRRKSHMRVFHVIVLHVRTFLRSGFYSFRLHSFSTQVLLLLSCVVRAIFLHYTLGLEGILLLKCGECRRAHFVERHSPDDAWTLDCREVIPACQRPNPLVGSQLYPAATASRKRLHLIVGHKTCSKAGVFCMVVCTVFEGWVSQSTR